MKTGYYKVNVTQSDAHGEVKTLISKHRGMGVQGQEKAGSRGLASDFPGVHLNLFSSGPPSPLLSPYFHPLKVKGFPYTLGSLLKNLAWFSEDLAHA